MGLEARSVVVELDGRIVVRGIDLAVAPGRWCSIAGPNGAGKTSLLRAIAGLIHHRGDVVIGGRSLDHLRPMDRARLVALVPQQPVIPAGVTVLDYVLLGRTAHLPPLGVESASDVTYAEEVITALDLETFRDRHLASMSGGERQRAVIARALAQAAPVLLLDEPTAGLDLGHQQDVLDLVTQMCRERQLTVVSTMHDLTLAGSYSDDLMLMADGAVVAHGPVDETLNAENLARVTRARFRIVDEDGTKVVVPLPPRARRA